MILRLCQTKIISAVKLLFPKYGKTNNKIMDTDFILLQQLIFLSMSHTGVSRVSKIIFSCKIAINAMQF